jgi:hypothetical protein
MVRQRSSIYDIPFLTTSISLSGILSLSLAGMLPWPIFALIAVLHLIVYAYLFHKDIPSYLFGVVITAIFCIEGVRIFLQGREVILPALRDMIVILAVTRLVLKKTIREIYQIVGISLAECILATVFTISPVFLIGIMINAFLIPLVLYLLDSLEFHEELPLLPPYRHWAMVFLGIVGVSSLLFFMLPRPSSTLLNLGLAERHKTGFSEEVNLARAGALEQDRTIVMRIIWVYGKAPKQFYLAGARLEHLSRYGFRKIVAPATSLRKSHVFSDRLTIYPTGLDSKNLFYPFTLIGTLPDIAEVQGVNSYWRMGTPPFYDVLVSRSPLLQDPSHNVSFPEEMGTVRALARNVAGQGSTSVRVKRMQEYLGTHCTYSLQGIGTSAQKSPIETFLSHGKGACEHFASSMAAMLRAVGIPARVVTGFLVSEFNTTGNYYIVRASDAHAWVEYWDGAWHIVDPTPQSIGFKSRASLLDNLRFRWIRWVIEYSLQDQINLAVYVRMNVPRMHKNLAGLNTWIAIAIAATLGAIIALYIPHSRMGNYARVLHTFSAKGVPLDESASHEEHLLQVAEQWPELAPYFGEYLEHYLAWRFGGADTDIKPLTTALIAKVRATSYQFPASPVSS